jgi:hypothetical protein
MELYIWLSITLSANTLIFNFSCCLKQLPPFPCRFNFCIIPLLQEVQAPGLNFIWKKQFSMFFSLPRLYLTLATIKTSEFSTLGRCILKRVRFLYKNVWQIIWKDAIIESAVRLYMIIILTFCRRLYVNHA